MYWNLHQNMNCPGWICLVETSSWTLCFESANQSHNIKFSDLRKTQTILKRSNFDVGSESFYYGDIYGQSDVNFFYCVIFWHIFLKISLHMNGFMWSFLYEFKMPLILFYDYLKGICDARASLMYFTNFADC